MERIVRVSRDIRWVHLIPECEHADHGILVVCCSDDRFAHPIIEDRAAELFGRKPLSIVIPAPTLALRDPEGGPYLIRQMRMFVRKGLVWEIDLWEHIHCAAHEAAAPDLRLDQIVHRQQHGLLFCREMLMNELAGDGLRAVGMHFADWEGHEKTRVTSWQEDEVLQLAAD